MVLVPHSRARASRRDRTASAAVAIAVALAVLGWSGPSAAAELAPVRMVVGSTVIDSAGNTWQTASGTVGGKVSSVNTAIAGTTDDALYQRERTGLSAWDVPVGGPGTYTVLMRQAELTVKAPGRRVFDVKAEGAVVVPKLDIFAQAGGNNRALDVTFDVVVDDGTLSLAFVKHAGQPKVSSMQVTFVPAPKTEPSASPAPVKPGPDTTGVPPETPLREHFGDLTITEAGTHLDAVDIHGYVTIKAPNVRITRSIIRGSAATLSSHTGLINSYDPANVGLVIEDSELRPEYPSYWQEGIKAQNATLRRVEITGTVDGVGVHGDALHVVDSWIHDLAYYDYVPYTSDNKSHNDGIQVHLGQGLRVVNSTITGGSSAAIMVTPSTGVVGDAQIVGNWLNHGGCTVNISEKGRGPIQGLVIQDNRFGRDTSVVDCPILMPATTAAIAVTTGNVYDDTGLPVPIRTN